MDTDVKALFIGDKAENADFYIQTLQDLLSSHMGWRKNYMPQDAAAISEDDKLEQNYIDTENRTIAVMQELDNRMRAGAIPWMSAGRYWGQMNSDTLLAPMLAYSYAMLWNSNNVALESSMATSQMEAEVGQDFCNLLGFPDGWGHLLHDGSMANLEGLWYARCVSSIPLALAQVVPDVVAGKDQWALLNMSVDEILDICAKLDDATLDEVKARSSRSGQDIGMLGKWIVPQTKHYSWSKAVDITGVGLDNMIEIPVGPNYRMDIDALDKTIAQLVAEKTPILGVVAVVGTTEEGAIDECDKVAALKAKYAAQGINFYFHVDAAYGAYGRALILDTDGSVIPYANLDQKLKEHDVFHFPVTISEAVYKGLVAIDQADSVTIDPHKMGYVPYSVGGIAIRRAAMHNIVSYNAPYVFEKKTDSIPDMIGAYIIGGSKAGANAAAVWAAHRVCPLNISGYGRLVGASIEAAQRFRKLLGELSFTVGNQAVEVYVLDNPDFNMVNWTFKIKGCTDLEKTNALNEAFFNATSFYSGKQVYNLALITSHTAFSKDEYGASPVPFVEQMGMTAGDFEKVGQVTLLRAAVMTPYLQGDDIFAYYAGVIKQAMQEVLEAILPNLA